MRVAEFLREAGDAHGPSQELAMDLIEGMSPIGFAALVADIALHHRLLESLKQASRRVLAKTKDRHPVTMEMLDAE